MAQKGIKARQTLQVETNRQERLFSSSLAIGARPRLPSRELPRLSHLSNAVVLDAPWPGLWATSREFSPLIGDVIDLLEYAFELLVRMILHLPGRDIVRDDTQGVEFGCVDVDDNR